MAFVRPSRSRDQVARRILSDVIKSYSASASPFLRILMTELTGKSFLSYRRSRRDEAARLIQAQHVLGIPTWQDTRDLASAPTEDELRRVLSDPLIANSVVFLTPECETSDIIRKVEIPLSIKRAAADDGFFLVPVASGGLSYDDVN